jgi:fumarate reductase (CoM/CoB) subunit A
VDTYGGINMSTLEMKTDVLVVGSGGAALRAALAAESSGAEVLVAVKGAFAKSGASFYSVAEVGAFNVPDGAADPSDSPEQFYQDIMEAGLEMSDPRLSRILAEEAIDAMRYLEQYGVVYEKQDHNYLAFKACFSTKPRSHVIQNHFKPIVKALGQEATRRNIKVIDRLMISNLIVRSGQCYGAYAMDQDGNMVVIRAKATILTTGGASQLFEKNLYPYDITGDGYAMAYRAGAHLVNMEFMQAGISLISPFMNLFGNYLWDAYPNITNKNGQLFIHKYLENGLTVKDVMQEKGKHFPFSSRDISRYIEVAIHKEINSGNGTEDGGVFLDFTSTDFDTVLADKNSSIAKMWPLSYNWYLKKNVDLYKDKVEITTSAHAINGGLKIDEHAQSNLKGLFAAGEVAGGPHGADRLGGNMSITCQVFGRRAGEAAAKFAKECTSHSALPDLYDEQKEYLHRFKGKGIVELRDLKRQLQKAANRNLLIIRTEQGLSSIQKEADEIEHLLLNEVNVHDPKDFIRAMELQNLLDVARIMATAAKARKESRGGHFREDFPQMDKEWNKNIFLDVTHPDGMFTARLQDR